MTANPVSPRVFSPKIAGIYASVLVVCYAALSGFETIDDPDVWWQMAAGRAFLASGHVPRTEIFSYTVQGTPWTYPILSGALFQWLYSLGGFTLLSLVSPLVGAAIAFLMVRKGGVLRAAIVMLAIPAITNATAVRANMFTTLLATVFLVVLWDELNPWILPPLMVLWVNLHPGFIYGLGIVTAFTLIRPRKLGLVTVATLAATLANPWGWRIYEAIFWQSNAMSFHQYFIAEWRRTPVSWAVLHDAFLTSGFWLDTGNSYWWLMIAAGIAVVAALLRKRLWGPFLLAGSAIAALMFIRFHGLFSVAAGIIVPDLLLNLRSGEKQPERAGYLHPVLAFGGAALLAAGLAYRTYDLVTDRRYQGDIILSDFGAGVAHWLPRDAARFIEDHHLPHQLYVDYAVGGFAMWSLAPKYPVFIDGRALPYGAELFFQQVELTNYGPDDPKWQRMLQSWKIKTVLLDLERFIGYRGGAFYDFCQSKRMKLVYLDSVAAVFVVASETDLPAIDPNTVIVKPPPPDAPVSERYHFWTNIGTIYFILHRTEDADRAFAEALKIYDRDAVVHQALGLVRRVQGRWADGEAELHLAIKLRPAPSSYDALGNMLLKHRRPLEAMEAFRHSIERESEGYKNWASLGEAALIAGYPNDALKAAQLAIDTSRWRGPAEEMGRVGKARALIIKGTAMLALFQVEPAVSALEEASRLAPSDRTIQGPIQAGLADAYLQTGRVAEAKKAFAKARELGTDDGPYGATMQRLEWQLGVM